MVLRIGPLAPAAQQREIKTEQDGSIIHGGHDGGIFFQLSPIALLLQVQELLDIAGFVTRGLVVNDPADAVLVNKSPVDDDIDDIALESTAEGVFAGLFPVVGQSPADAGVRQNSRQGLFHPVAGLIQFLFWDAEGVQGIPVMRPLRNIFFNAPCIDPFHCHHL